MSPFSRRALDNAGEAIFVGLSMLQTLGKAICLMLVLEGMVPFLWPARWRQLVLALAVTSDRQLRIGGFICMLLGVLVLSLLN